MKYWCYEKVAGDLREADFLNTGAKQYLDTCEPEIYGVWKKRSESYADVSLANTLKDTIRLKFENRTIGVRPDVSENYSVIWLFQHRNDTSGKILELYRTASQTGTCDFLVVTQSPEFKTKFKFDGSTMTFESIDDDYDEFVHILKPQQELRLFFLVLADIDLHTSDIERNGKHFLQLHESDASRGLV